MDERVCITCRFRYTDEARHVTTDVHLEAMADESVREWLALSPFDAEAVRFAKQLARLARYAGDFAAWCAALGLDDNDESLLLNRRISWCWIKSIGLPGVDERMAYAETIIRLEAEGASLKDLKEVKL